MRKRINNEWIYYLERANFLSDNGRTFKDSFKEDFPYCLSRMLITVLPNSSSGLSKIIFIAVGTPTASDGISADLKNVYKVAKDISKNINNMSLPTTKGKL